jgi:hypothetical protein
MLAPLNSLIQVRQNNTTALAHAFHNAITPNSAGSGSACGRSLTRSSAIFHLLKLMVRNALTTNMGHEAALS